MTISSNTIKGAHHPPKIMNDNDDDLTYHEWLVKEIADMERRLANHVVSPGIRTIYEYYLAGLRRDLRQSEGNE